MLRDKYHAIRGKLGISNDIAVTMSGVGEDLLLTIHPATLTQKRKQAVMLTEDDVRDLVDDFNKWLACR